MECADVAKCDDLAYCQGDDAIIHIGELEEYSGYEDGEELRILFTDLATQYRTIIPIVGAELPELVINSETFSPTDGHVYEVKVTRIASGGGITPLRVLPFETIYTGYTLSTTAYDALLVRFVRIMTTTPAVSTSTEQWLTVE